MIIVQKYAVLAACVLLILIAGVILPAGAATGIAETATPTEMPTAAEPTEVPTTEPTTVPTMVTAVETTEPVPGPLAPVAGFTAYPVSGNGPLTVRFTDTSLNIPTMWYWDFGDGTNEGTASPAHTYAAPGTYSVTLTATNQYGSDTITRTDLITVNGPVMTGSIFAQSSPAGATISVNGNSYGTSPVTINDLAPDSYAMMAVLNGYVSDTQTITVNPGETAGYYPTLQPSPSPPGTPGSISARSTPAGAMIYINGVAYGTSPRTVNNLLPGAYSVMATLSGYSTDTQVVTVNSGQTTGYYPVLRALPVPTDTGAIFAQSTPAGASIYLNGAYQGIAPVTLANLNPGTYTLRASLNGWADDVQQVTVRAGRVSVYAPVLSPSPPVAGSGQGIIAVYANVNGASVYFDNTSEGTIANGVLFVPVAVTGTPVKTIRVESPGFAPWITNLAQWPANGEIVRVQAVLVPGTVPPATTRAPLPATLGICALIGAGAVLVAARRR